MHWFLNPVTQHYADFSGRATRQQYWMFVLFNFIFSFLAGFVDGLLGTTLVAVIFTLVVLIPSVALTTRRLHDIGRSGWWQLIYFIPLVGILVMLYWLIKDTQSGTNMYGENPKGVAAPEAEDEVMAAESEQV